MSREVEKKWTTFIKLKSKENGWKFKNYFSFKKNDIFLFDFMFWINGKTNSLSGVLHFKFADIDNLFWALTVDNDKIENYPLSLKVDGSHLVRPIDYYRFELKDINETSLSNLLETIDKKVIEINEKFSSKEIYFEYIKNNKALNEYSYLTNLLYLNKHDELLFFIAYCKKNKITSGLSFYKNGETKDYFDIIIKYVDLKKGSR